MASSAQALDRSQTIAATLEALAAAEGSRGHLYVSGEELLKNTHTARNLSDAIHLLAALHGRHPGVIDHAAVRTADPAARAWMIAAVDGIAAERHALARLVVAVGPIPGTPGQAESEAAVNGQHHALDMLASSDRTGCAFGAAAALVLDWAAIRPVLDHAARRVGVEIEVCALPGASATLDLAEALGTTPAIERAMAFGAQQLFGQHRGLWDLLEARAIARGEY